MKTQTLLGWVLTHEDLLWWVAASVLVFVVNLLSQRKSSAEWELWALSKPWLAFVIELLRKFGIDPFGVAKAVYRLAMRRKGQIPKDAFKAADLPESVKLMLAHPELRTTLAQLAEKALDERKVRVPKLTPSAPLAIEPKPDA